MHPRSPTVFGIMALAAASWMTPSGAAFAQASPAAATHGIPQAMRIEQKETIEQLTILAASRRRSAPPPRTRWRCWKSTMRVNGNSSCRR